MTRAYFRFKRGREGAKKLAPDNGTWWIDYRDALGRRHQERTPALLKAEAERIAHERADRAYRQRKGLEPGALPPITFADAAKRYRAAIAHFASAPDVDAQLRLYIEPVLGKKLLSEVTPADVEACVNGYRGQLAPGSLFGLHIRIGAVFRWAIRRGKLYRGDNPATDAVKPEVPERIPRFLTKEQLVRLFEATPVSDRLVQLFAVLTGMRKGEIAGLLWENLDLERGVVTVRFSYDKPRTKGRRDRLVPVHDDLLPELQRLRSVSKSRWVFPNPKGEMRTESWDAAENMKAALRRAGLVKGYEHKCRRSSCLHHFEAPTATPMPCPRCQFRTWPVGLPIDITFKDLRSTFATHLAERGDLRLVQRLLGHSTPEITERAYAAARLQYLRQGLKGLSLKRDEDGTRDTAADTQGNPRAAEGE